MKVQPAANEARARRRFLILISSLSLLVTSGVGVAVAIAMLSDPPRQRLRLPNGAVITLEAATYGRQATLRGAWWRKLLYWVLPHVSRARAGCRVYQGYEDATLTFHTSVRPPTAAGASCSVVALDEHGCTTDPRYDIMGLDPGLEAHAFRVFPRRGRTVALRYLWHDARGKLLGPAGEFRVRNPDPGPHPSWIVESAPVTRSAGDLRVTFTGFRLGMKRPGTDYGIEPTGAELERLTRATFHITRRGRPDFAWRILLLTLSDASGNVWDEETHYRREGPRQAPVEYCYFDTDRLPDERVWKVHAELSPEEATPYGPEEVWTARGVPVPPHGKTLTLGKAATVAGVPVELVAVAGPGATIRGEMLYNENSALLRVKVRASWPPAFRPGLSDSGPRMDSWWEDRIRSRRLFLIARDEQGRSIPGSERSGEIVLDEEPDNSGNWTGIAALRVSPGVKKLDLSLVVHRNRTVEFRVESPALRMRRP